MSFYFCLHTPINSSLNEIINQVPTLAHKTLFSAVLLILASQRIEDIVGWDLTTDTTKRGSLPSAVEYCILAWVAGLIWSEIKQLWDVGLKEYVNDMWNVVDFITNSLYLSTIGLRTVAYFDVVNPRTSC